MRLVLSHVKTRVLGCDSLCSPGGHCRGCSLKTDGEMLAFGNLAWHIILIVAQPGRKRDPDAPAEEAPVFRKIVKDHLSRIFV